MDYNIIRSGRRTISIQVNEDLSVTVRAPWHTSNGEIALIVADRAQWIQKTRSKLRRRQAEEAMYEGTELSGEEIEDLTRRARRYIPTRVEYYAELIGVDYGRISIRCQKTRWGSCSSKGNLNFNCLLMLTPPEIIDYVVVHELCHRLEMNHSNAFWQQVERVLPDYRKRRKWLKEAGNVIMYRAGK